MAGNHFPEAWRSIVIAWAKERPLITAMYLFGSRAKDFARDDSDIDLAFQTRSNGDENPYTVAFFNKRTWQAELQALLPVHVDLQYADPAEDEIVWPAVLDHGIRLL